MVAQDLLDLVPHPLERIRTGLPSSRLPHLARHLLVLPVLPCRFLILSRFRRRLGHGRFALCQLHQSSHLLIRYHPSILQNQQLGPVTFCSGNGNFNCRWSGVLIVADQRAVLSLEGAQSGAA